MTDAAPQPSPLDIYQDFTPARLSELGFLPIKRPAAAPHLTKWPFGTPSQEVLDVLGLSFYHNRDSNWLLGSTDESLHPHERWLYLHETDFAGWQQIDHHEHSTRNAQTLSSVLAEEAQTVAPLSTKNEGLTNSNFYQLKPYRLRLQPMMRAVLTHTKLTPVQLHNLVFHYDIWAKDNDSIGLPRDIAWRMHGLGETSLKAQHTRKSVVFGLWMDHAFLSEEEEREGALKIRTGDSRLP